ncbi:hypothetical protein VTK26DRAFT_5687 [Humicola hyalothermophila]
MAFNGSARVGYHGPVDRNLAPAPPLQIHQFSPRHSHTRSTGGRMTSSSRVSDFEIWDGLDGLEGLQHVKADSSSSDEDIHPPGRSQRPTHSRSMSHPFPSLFSYVRKKPSVDKSNVTDNMSSSDSDFDDGGASSSNAARTNATQTRGHGKSSLGGTRGEFATGRCMTCASLMRWPSELSVFKCTICLTINDLQPVDGRGGTGTEGSVQPISLGHTKELVNQCLRSFLLQTLTRRETPADGVAGNDPRVPERPSPATPDENRTPTQPPGTPSPAQRPDVSAARRPWLVPGGNRGLQTRHGRSPSWASPSPSSPGPLPFRGMPPFQGGAGSRQNNQAPQRERENSEPKRIFKPLEDYIIKSFTSFHRLNFSFVSPRTYPRATPEAASDRHRRQPSEHRPEPQKEQQNTTTTTNNNNNHTIPDLAPKFLPPGDVSETGTWRTSNRPEEARTTTRLAPNSSNNNSRSRSRSQNAQSSPSSIVNPRSPRINWAELQSWYDAVLNAARPWPEVYHALVYEQPALAVPTARLRALEARLLLAQDHVRRCLLKACEMALRRPTRRISAPAEMRFVLIVAANPLLLAEPDNALYAGRFDHHHPSLAAQQQPLQAGAGPGRHSGIVKRIAGLLANAPVECQNHLVAWLARSYPPELFALTKEMLSSFLAFRLNRQREKRLQAEALAAKGKGKGKGVDALIGGLVPSVEEGGGPAALHAVLGAQGQGQTAPGSGSGETWSGSGMELEGGGGGGGARRVRGRKQKRERKKRVVYREDWQIKAAAQVLGLFFAANTMGPHARRRGGGDGSGSGGGWWQRQRQQQQQQQQQILPTSDFYVTLLDDSDLVADFEAWEQRQSGRFAFCQFPFLLSIGAKIQILEYDARRQMEFRARDAFFDSILTNRVVQQFLVLSIRRECLVEDSLRAVSEVVGGGGEDVKKGLRIVFEGEEGVDAGGLRKEWFLLLVRELLNPDHGMFLYDEDSRYCYFNPNSLEPSEQFFLVGVVLGLAIYNSTILDVALPPFAFRKLVLAAPPPSVAPAQPRQPMTYTLDDLAEYRPALARGLARLLEYDGDGSSDQEEEFEALFGGLDFTVSVERYGAVETVPLCPGGERRAVTRENRREYVDLYVRYLLDTAVARQFEPFKRGFFTVCGGNALSLFRPDEIELLVRGSGAQDEPIDVPALKGVAVYDGWDRKERKGKGKGRAATDSGGGEIDGVGDEGDDLAETEPTLRWFWETFEAASPRDQRRLLAFVTGSDRLPAMGAASLSMRISCLGDDCGRFPTARTCFNALALWRCASKERLEEVLWRAVRESEGFGLK